MKIVPKRHQYSGCDHLLHTTGHRLLSFSATKRNWEQTFLNAPRFAGCYIPNPYSKVLPRPIKRRERET
ncbi:hypothetical protein RRSWK_01425 [Rhodopirellula sp. SWK7]|nr:hypothetical protein RRSWK_01425 [Rhodopirellula sp. SWK7]